MWEMLRDVALDALLDTLKLLPFLLGMYILMEILEHKAGERALMALHRSGPFAPAIGSILGVVPQCGFSAAAAGFYGSGYITAGTLCAVFMSTSDELLPILLGHSFDALTILKILGIKVLAAMACGYLFELLLKVLHKTETPEALHDDPSHEHDHDDCQEGTFKKIALSVLKHTLTMGALILIINFALGLLLEGVGMERLEDWFRGVPFLANVLSAVVGLIPNCAASVLISTLYAEGILSGGAMMSGLLVGCGIGSVVLFRAHRHYKFNFMLLLYMFVMSIGIGYLLDLIGII